MGKKSRRVKPAKKETLPFVARPFEGLIDEGDWVSLREIIPAATASINLNDGRKIQLASMLPGAVAGLVKPDGTVWIGMQVTHAYGDASREIAHAIELSQSTEPGNVIVMTEPAPGPRLTDLVNPDQPMDVIIHDSFDFWFDDPLEEASLIEQANQAIVPTEKITTLAAAYRADFGEKVFLRWAISCPEDDALLALARLRARSEDSLDSDSRLIGAFRAYGILIPVWELDAAQSAQELERLMPAFEQKFLEALASTEEISPEIRSARSALSSRQVTLRP